MSNHQNLRQTGQATPRPASLRQAGQGAPRPAKPIGRHSSPARWHVDRLDSAPHLQRITDRHTRGAVELQEGPVEGFRIEHNGEYFSPRKVLADALAV